MVHKKQGWEGDFNCDIPIGRFKLLDFTVSIILRIQARLNFISQQLVFLALKRLTRVIKNLLSNWRANF